LADHLLATEMEGKNDLFTIPFKVLTGDLKGFTSIKGFNSKKLLRRLNEILKLRALLYLFSLSLFRCGLTYSHLKPFAIFSGAIALQICQSRKQIKERL